MHGRMIAWSTGVLIVGFSVLWHASPSQAADSPAEKIMEITGVQGGLVVHLGCRDVDFTVALRTNDHILVHGLDSNGERVATAREYIRAQGLYGPVSVDLFDGLHLPYADNLVNLIVVSDAKCRVSDNEILRVLAPRGVVLFSREHERRSIGLELYEAGDWLVYRKPVPPAIDDWTHYLHSAGGNPVADDDVVKPPRQLQWVTSPRWARHHEHMASMNALVSADGKVFSICDEGPKVSMMHPPEWKLSAHDAFNGLLLWERPIAEWFDHLQRLKRGPASLPRRLVAEGGYVYVTLGIRAPVSVLDAGTGETVLMCEGTENTQEIILSGDTLFLVRGLTAGTAISAVNARTGALLWETQCPVSTFTLAADAGKVVFFDGSRVVALRRDDGSQLWVSGELGEERKSDWLAKDAPRLILADNTVVVAPKKNIYALSADEGTVRWSAEHPVSGYMSPKDLFVINDLVWYGDTAGGKSTGRFVGRDLLTGEIVKSFDPDIDIVWLSHHRCHFSKATTNFILPARMGVEFVDIENEAWKQNHWVRGGCIYGVMPCNGLLYTPPHACACYFEAKQTGFAAYTSNTGSAAESRLGKRLERGTAFGQIPIDKSPESAAAWPVFRHDSARSGHTASAVATDLAERWSVDLGGKLTQSVSVDGTVYVASIDRNTLHALDSETGRSKWRFVAGGRIDSPPSIYRGMAIFGSRDGWVYCLSCSDGQLAWRFRACPKTLLVMSYGRLESAWPVHGSVLIENDEVHCVAGRNMFLDQGLRYLRLEPPTGELISETVMDERDPLLGGSIQKYDSWLDMTTTLPDILSRDGETIYMRSLPLDTQGNRRRISHIAKDTETPHLFSPNGFLEDQWFHRSYWTYARSFPGGWIGHLNAGRYNPSGRLLVLDDSTIFGYGRKPAYYKWTTSLEYRLFAVGKTANPPRDIYAYDRFKDEQREKFPEMVIDKNIGLPFGPRVVAEKPYDCLWEDNRTPIHARAMVSTKDRLFVAGPRDIVDEQGFTYDDAGAGFAENRNDLERQSKLWTGQDGAVLLSLRKTDGSVVAEHRLDAIPVFDGMIAAEGKLFVSLDNGVLICLGDDR